MLGVSMIVLRTMLALVVAIGHAPSTPEIVDRLTSFGSLAPMLFPMVLTAVIVASPYAASLLPK